MPATAQRSIGRLLYLSLILATIAAGLLCRFSHIGLPPGIAKYGGSALWALMLYWLAALLLRRWQPFPLVIATGLFATAIEYLKLYHSPALDTFRLTLPGILLLGRFFSLWDIVAYWFAIATGALIDRYILRPPPRNVGR